MFKIKKEVFKNKNIIFFLLISIFLIITLSFSVFAQSSDDSILETKINPVSATTDYQMRDGGCEPKTTYGELYEKTNWVGGYVQKGIKAGFGLLQYQSSYGGCKQRLVQYSSGRLVFDTSNIPDNAEVKLVLRIGEVGFTCPQECSFVPFDMETWSSSGPLVDISSVNKELEGVYKTFDVTDYIQSKNTTFWIEHPGVEDMYNFPMPKVNTQQDVWISESYLSVVAGSPCEDEDGDDFYANCQPCGTSPIGVAVTDMTGKATEAKQCLLKEEKEDCDDKDPNINPNAKEICNNDKDDNCNNKKDCEEVEDCLLEDCNHKIQYTVSNPADYNLPLTEPGLCDYEGKCQKKGNCVGRTTAKNPDEGICLQIAETLAKNDCAKQAGNPSAVIKDSSTLLKKWNKETRECEIVVTGFVGETRGKASEAPGPSTKTGKAIKSIEIDRSSLLPLMIILILVIYVLTKKKK